MSAPTADIPSLPDLLEASGLGAPFQVEPLPGGRNNQVFQVTLPQLGRSVVLKSYFHGPSEPRDRAGAEWAFARFAWASGLRCIAQPLAWSPSAHCALFDFLPGVPVEPGALGAGEVAQALAFVLDLNRHRAVGGQLPLAAEACFSFSEHVELVRRRLRRLSGLAGHDPLTRQVHRFVHEEAEPALERVVAEGRLSLAGAHLDPTAPVPHERRCISPSDFGFHNALRGPDGTIYFFDFEYAGWDDPAKLVADFFNQIAVPVPPEHYETFVTAIITELGLGPAERARFDALTDLYAVKWAAIALNEFCPDGRDRRNFATSGAWYDRRSDQLGLARAKVASLGRV